MEEFAVAARRLDAKRFAPTALMSASRPPARRAAAEALPPPPAPARTTGKRRRRLEEAPGAVGTRTAVIREAALGRFSTGTRRDETPGDGRLPAACGGDTRCTPSGVSATQACLSLAWRVYPGSSPCARDLRERFGGIPEENLAVAES